MASYFGRVTIPDWRGVWQAEGEMDTDLRRSPHAWNMDTRYGLLASGAGVKRAFPALGAPIATLKRFCRRNRPDDPDVFVAAAGGALYTYTHGTEGWVKRAEGFHCDVWSSVTYETQEDGQTVDLLILSNAQDGMAAVYGSDLRVVRKPLYLGDAHEEVRFAVLERHAERIWGAGATGYPDAVFYSRPYDPFDWADTPDTPELGGGLIRQPTWDGEAFMALMPFGGYLLAVKPHTVMEIRGSDPSTFTVSEAYGTDGPVQAQTLCTDRLHLYYLAQNGLGVYNGSTLSLLMPEALEEVFRMRMPGTEHLASACLAGHTYLLALCVREHEDDVVMQNNTVIEYDTERGTFMVRKGLRVKAFFAQDGKAIVAQADAPYEILHYNAQHAGGWLTEPMETCWETPWIDADKLRIKRDFTLRMTAQADADDVYITFALETERTEHTRVQRLDCMRRNLCVRLPNAGTRFRIRIRSKTTVPWKILGGIQVDYTMDEA